MNAILLLAALPYSAIIFHVTGKLPWTALIQYVVSLLALRRDAPRWLIRTVFAAYAIWCAVSGLALAGMLFLWARGTFPKLYILPTVRYSPATAVANTVLIAIVPAVVTMLGLRRQTRDQAS